MWNKQVEAALFGVAWHALGLEMVDSRMWNPLSRLRLRTRMVLTTAIIAALATAVVAAVGTQVGHRLLRSAVDTQAISLAKSAAALVEPRTRGDQGPISSNLSQREGSLLALLQGGGARRICVLAPRQDGGRWACLLDRRSSKGFALPLVRRLRNASLDTGLRRQFALELPTGRNKPPDIAALAPVYNARGETTAVAVAEISAARLEQQQSALSWGLLTAAIGALLISVAISSWRARALLKPLAQLSEAAGQVAAGRADLELPTSRRDELGDLAKALSQIAQTLHESGERANTDGLTRLFNYRHFQQRLRQEIARAKRFGGRLGLLVMDLDQFKLVNDQFGHQAGDEVLRTMAAIAQQAVREIDVVARYGGDEFVVILAECDILQAERVAERIREQIATQAFTVWSNGDDKPASEQQLHLSTSIGVAAFPGDAVEADNLIAAADAALTRAKQTGRNRVCTRASSGVLEGESDCIRVHQMLHGSTLGAAASGKGQGEDLPFDCSRCRSVTRYAVALGLGLEMKEKELENVRRTGLLHDLGHDKGAGDNLPPSPGATNGQNIPQALRVGAVMPGLLHHHEWWNGRGFPDGLQGEEIPLIARILSIAETYQVLTNNRGFRPAYDHSYAIAELRRHAGVQFDPRLVEVFAQTLGDDPDQHLSEIGCQAAGQKVEARR